MASSKPEWEVLGAFSIDEEGHYKNDKSQRRFLVESVNDHLDFNFLEGIGGYIARKRRKFTSSPLTQVLEWIQDHNEELIQERVLENEVGGTRKMNADFVGSGNVFSLLLRACETIDHVEILVRRDHGTFYIETSTRSNPQRRQARIPQPLLHVRPQLVSQKPLLVCLVPEQNEKRKIEFAGKKFSTCVTTIDDGGVPSGDEPVNVYAKYMTVTKMKFGEHIILQSNEVHAERSQGSDSVMTSPENCVLFRTKKAHLDGKALMNFNRYKTMRWWSQAYIAGVPEILCGMRDDTAHQIKSVKTMKVEDLPGMSGGFWDPRMCRKKFRNYLSDIKRLITKDNPRVVYRLELPEVRLGPNIKDRLQRRTFIISEGDVNENSVIIPDQYRREVLCIREGV
ncbi:decapping and exoribonuclease protein-like [Lytechinus variegatus]|uniref:decapping and exoribonuclease protein-like n=1 Tax=Lytechinus variegatus TaxID=7654 RepID=UPI001BB1286C|nr:decapping and exoribonuclease protein-like [Lytechinus variegatus]